MKNDMPIKMRVDEIDAILAGRKTQVRRVVKPQPTNDVLIKQSHIVLNDWICVRKKDNVVVSLWKCPYGTVGTHLYVQGRHAGRGYFDTVFITDSDPRIGRSGVIENGLIWDGSSRVLRRYSMLMLKVAGIRVERLQDISAQDLEAERGYPCTSEDEHRGLFVYTWNKRNKQYSWESNPYVWVVEFERKC